MNNKIIKVSEEQARKMAEYITLKRHVIEYLSGESLIVNEILVEETISKWKREGFIESNSLEKARELYNKIFNNLNNLTDKKVAWGDVAALGFYYEDAIFKLQMIESKRKNEK